MDVPHEVDVNGDELFVIDNKVLLLLSCLFVSRSLVLANLCVYAHDAHKIFDEMPCPLFRYDF
jgi:hypothetical protein